MDIHMITPVPDKDYPAPGINFWVWTEVGSLSGLAWFMGHRIREAMNSNPQYQLGGNGTSGIVEADETYTGNRNDVHRSQRLKTWFVGSYRLRSSNLRAD